MDVGNFMPQLGAESYAANTLAMHGLLINVPQSANIQKFNFFIDFGWVYFPSLMMTG